MRTTARLLASGALGWSLLGLGGCVHSPDDLLSGRTDRLRQRFAAQPDGRAEAKRESQRLARSLALGWNDDETADPFLREDRRLTKQDAVEIAARHTSDDRDSRRADVLASAAEQTANRKPNQAAAATRSNKGKTSIGARPPLVSRRNFDTELNAALAESRGSDDVELLTAPPRKATADAATKARASANNDPPVKLTRPIPDDDQAVAKRAAAASDSPVVAAIASAPRPNGAGIRTQPAAESFVVRIRPAVPSPAPAVAEAPRIARVNANQPANDVAPLTQSAHQQDARAVSVPVSESSPHRSIAPTPEDSVSVSDRILRAPANSAVSAPMIALNSSPPVATSLGDPALAHRPSAVHLEATVEPDDEPASPLGSLGLANGPAMSFTSDPFAAEMVPRGPALSSTISNSKTEPRPVPKAQRSPDDDGGGAPTAPKPSHASIWFWLGSVCGLCGLVGLLMLSRLERRRFALASVLERRRETPRRWRSGRTSAGRPSTVNPRRAA
jgi:hypothetical protein